LNANASLAIGNRLNLKRMKITKGTNLVKRQRGVINQPNGGGFWHQ
jgi:hypothetical protein